ncbi:hypothetical protein NOK12_19490 [Nocardioides sp. OK12]|uniref:DUF2867 domain-containing protein n=1 Tax=Nocardioides sp. OK12 TaxID=2758661 RepID=UPI0021C31D14|nr:DUF2867 domain-containing protein [Nocardioides sp. OK12]GHJ59431.1 hypothetical protein NOK12_19490 [Nocardioides sp. OK12]
MERRTSLTSATRASRLSLDAAHAWRLVASARAGPQWYVDAAPFVLRGAVDRLALGRGRRWPVPDRPVLRAGDTAGFWEVVESGPVAEGPADHHRLVLEAQVRAPGTVRLTTEVTPEGPRCCRVAQTVTFTPSGVLGRAYLLTDVPAREALMELVHRRVVRDLERAAP